MQAALSPSFYGMKKYFEYHPITVGTQYSIGYSKWMKIVSAFVPRKDDTS